MNIYLITYICAMSDYDRKSVTRRMQKTIHSSNPNYCRFLFVFQYWHDIDYNNVHCILLYFSSIIRDVIMIKYSSTYTIRQLFAIVILNLPLHFNVLRVIATRQHARAQGAECRRRTANEAARLCPARRQRHLHRNRVVRCARQHGSTDTHVRHIYYYYYFMYRCLVRSVTIKII